MQTIIHSFTFKLIVTVLLIGILLCGTAVSAPRAQAAQQTSDIPTLIQKLLKQITELQVQLKKTSSTSELELIQGETPEHSYTPTDDGKTGRAKITINKPSQRAEFDKTDDNDPIVVTWDAKNIPDNSVVEIELDNVKLSGGSGVGGGIWQGEIPEGDSTGSYKWAIYGEGRSDAGVYRVRTSVRACHSDGCEVNPRFPGQKEKIKTYAKSVWHTISIVDKENDVNFGSYKAVLNGKTVDSVSEVTEEEADELCSDVYNDYDQYDFGPGDVLKCYWGGSKFITVDSWKG